jgi:GntR family transcriptional regulator
MMPTLDRSSPLPLYHQLEVALRSSIEQGALLPNHPIPSEPELMRSYGVSRATVRQALGNLVSAGLLYREHGRGTFVCEPRLRQRQLGTLVSLTEELRRAGKQPGGSLLAHELVRGSAEIRHLLQLAEEEQVLRLERVRSADAKPIAFEVDSLPYPQSTSVYRRVQELAAGSSLYQLMASEGLRPFLAEQAISGGGARARESELLCIPEGESGLRLDCTAYDERGMPLVHSELFFPATRYAFHLTLGVAQ